MESINMSCIHFDSAMSFATLNGIYLVIKDIKHRVWFKAFEKHSGIKAA